MDEFTEGYTKVLLELEKVFWEREIERDSPSGFSKEALRAAGKIFTSVLMELMWSDQEKRMLSMDERVSQAEACGKEIRALIDRYTAVDSTHLYDSYTLPE